MALRVFKCHDCNHRMRFAGQYCGKCYAKKEGHQLPALWITLLVILGIIGLIALVRFVAG